MKKLTLLFTFTFLLFTHDVFSQTIPDGAKRNFNNRNPIKIDLDGDKIKDTIQPRIYTVISKPAKKRSLTPFDSKNWIAFDLTTSKGLKIKSFFKYRYGTGEADYWVYVLKSAGDLNIDGKTDLVFYVGDDTSDETIWLTNKSKRFDVFKRKIRNY